MSSSRLVLVKNRLEHNKVAEVNKKKQKDREEETDPNWSSGADERDWRLTRQPTNPVQGRKQFEQIVCSLPHTLPQLPIEREEKRREGGGRRAAAWCLRVWVGAVQSRQRHCSSLQPPPSNCPPYSECSPGPSPLKQERSGRSTARLHTPLLPLLCWLREQLLWSHAWVLGRGEWQGGVCSGEMHSLYLSVVVVMVNFCFSIWRRLRQNKCLSLFLQTDDVFFFQLPLNICIFSLKKKNLMLFWINSAGGHQSAAVKRRWCGACCVYVLRSEGETAASVSNDGSLFDSGPLTHLRPPTCSDAHTTADKHVSVCVHGCVAQVLVLLRYHPFWQPWNRWVKLCVCVRKGKERKMCLCVFLVYFACFLCS